jgi:hypothetical protein
MKLIFLFLLFSGCVTAQNDSVVTLTFPQYRYFLHQSENADSYSRQLKICNADNFNCEQEVSVKTEQVIERSIQLNGCRDSMALTNTILITAKAENKVLIKQAKRSKFGGVIGAILGLLGLGYGAVKSL